MMGARIARWTMSYFAVAIAWLLVALALMVAGIGYPATDLTAPDTLVLVHVICLGWLSVAMCGALFQFVPVLVAKPLLSEKCALPALGLLTAGLLLLLAGFLAMANRLPAPLALLPAGAVLLIAGLGLVVLDLGLTICPQPKGPARFVLAGLASLCATVAFGTFFAFARAGWAGSPGDTVLADGVPLHAIAGLGGWLTLTAIGVSYRLLPMFMLSPDVSDGRSRMTFVAGGLAVASAVIVGSLAIGLALGRDLVLSIAGVLGLASIALYARDVIGMFGGRKRRHLELNMRMAALSLVSLAATALLGVVLVSTGAFVQHVGAFGFLAAFGWLSGLILAKLYKIVAFLTWLETYGPVMGRVSTPRVQDLVAEQRASRWFVIYYAAVWSATLMLLIDQPSAFRAAAAVMTAGVLGIVREILRTRRLANVIQDLRLPAGTRAPRLFFARG